MLYRYPSTLDLAFIYSFATENTIDPRAREKTREKFLLISVVTTQNAVLENKTRVKYFGRLLQKNIRAFFYEQHFI